MLSEYILKKEELRKKMPGLLGPTNPVPGYDATPVRVTTPQAGDTTVENIINPEQVTRPDNRPERQDTGDAANAARYDSGFVTFLQRLRGSAALPDSFMRVLGQATQVSSGIRAGFAGELAEFLEFVSMDENELAGFLQNQLQSGSRYGGALFEVLRQTLAQSPSEITRGDILQFLRRYSDFTSTDHIESGILRTTEDMADALPSPWSGRLSEILSKLQNGVAAGDREGNLKLLKEDVVPLLARYVGETHDHGRARGLLSTLMLNMTRYENGSEKSLVQSLRTLAGRGVLPEEMENLSDKELLRLLKETEYNKASANNTFANKLSELTGRALRGEAGVSTQETFQSIMQAVLINESVYMPLTHIMLPVNWNGELMFSELWVDTDADRRTRHGDMSADPTLRILIKMDIKSLGAFDVLINSRKEEGVSLSVACPQSVAERSEEISEALSGILQRNGLKTAAVRVGAMSRPLTVSEVFPKIFEGVNGLNVSV